MVPVAEWGRRLSDTVRATLRAGDIAEARRLVLEGDGQARNLAQEYALMYRGLGITIRVMLPLLREAASRVPEPERDLALAEVAALLRAFRRDMAAFMTRAYGPASPFPVGGEASGHADLDAELGRTERLLDASEAAFDREHRRAAQEIVQALDAGDAARAQALVDTKERVGYVPLHDRFVRFLAESFAWVLKRCGAAELLRFHLATAEAQRRGFERWDQLPAEEFAWTTAEAQRRGFERWDQLPAEEFAWTTAFLLKQHMSALVVREDSEKFTLEQTPCGSGGRLKLSGAYEGPAGLPFVEEPGPLTFAERRLAVYCSHCPIWNGVAPLRWFGRPHWVFENPSRPDGSCTLHIYKRRDGAPRGYAERLATNRDVP